MEATKKTSTTKTALLIVAALSMLLSGLFIATASRSDATPTTECPDGWSLTADAKNCFQAAVVTSADNPNSCDVGQLTPDGTKCYVLARLIPQEGDTLCPKGYSPDDSLGAMCARFDAATQNKPTCPDGARGTAGSCYILVAKGPAGASTCVAPAVLTGTQCVITGDAPVNGPSTCVVSATVLKSGTECYTLIGKPAPDACASPYVDFGLGTSGLTQCKNSNPNPDDPALAGDFTCPAVAGREIGEVGGPLDLRPAETTAILYTTHMVGTVEKIASCGYELDTSANECPEGTTPDPNGADCRRPVDLKPGALVCASGYGLVSGKCIRYVAVDNAAPQCPVGSVEDAVGDCRKPVADAKGTYYCKDANAALNGKSCVWISGFLIDPAPDLYKCAAGVRTVIGFGGLIGQASSVSVICILGDANPNTTTGPSCLQGVLSTDGAYCLIARVDTAPATVVAPVPAFTG